MSTFHIVLILAAILCSLVAGLVFAFACVTMPGLAKLDDREFIRAFQFIDRVIQDRQPVFILVWAGSAVAGVAACVLGVPQLVGGDRIVLIVAALTYLFGVQLPTLAINVPLNNQLQTFEVAEMDETALAQARADFEPRWNRWNLIRTLFAVATSLLLSVLLLRL